MAGLRVVLEQIEQHEAVDVGQAEIERDRVGWSLRAIASVPAPAVETTPLRPASRAMSSRIEAKVGSSSTISTNGSLAERVAVVAELERGRQGGGHDRAAIVVAGRWCRLADRRQARSAWSGTNRVKVEPSPGFERTCSSPPSRRAISRLIERPRPVPPYLRLVVPSACWNASKISFCLSSGMPMPVSVTAISIACSASRSTGWLVLQPPVAARTASVTPPCAVNLKALDSRLSTTCWSRFSSVRIVARQVCVELDVEVEALVGGELAEGPLHMLLEAGHRHVADLDRDRAGFDLRQIEDVVDQVEQVGAGAS